MPTRFNRERIAEGRTRITLTLPERSIGELDVEVAKQKIVGNWLRRNDAIDRALPEFLHDGAWQPWIALPITERWLASVVT